MESLIGSEMCLIVILLIDDIIIEYDFYEYAYDYTSLRETAGTNSGFK